MKGACNEQKRCSIISMDDWRRNACRSSSFMASHRYERLLLHVTANCDTFVACRGIDEWSLDSPQAVNYETPLTF